MIITIVILSLLLAASLTGNVLVTRRALKIDSTLLAGGAAVEQCLDSINISYQVVGKIVQMPLASNDAKVIQIHRELQRVHANLLAVATKLAQSWNPEEEKKAPASDADEE